MQCFQQNAYILSDILLFEKRYEKNVRFQTSFFSPTKGKEFLASSLPKGAFNNYVDQILLNFEFPSSGKNGILRTIFLFLRDSPMDILLIPHPPLLVHVVIE